MPYQYVQNVNRYRDTSTGRFVSMLDINVLVTQSIAAAADRTGALAALVANGSISAETFTAQFRDQVKQEFLRQAMLGKGGREAMTSRDWGIVGRQLRDQYVYIDGFAADIANGRYTDSEAALRYRMDMYFESARQSFNRMRLEAHNIRGLPQIPGDGKTACLTKCQCTLEIVQMPNGALIYWRMNAKALHCADCPSLAAKWNPLIFENGKFVNLNLNDLPISKADWLLLEENLRDWIAAIADGETFTVAAHHFHHHEDVPYVQA
jgi:hypothetical protein